MPPVASRYFKSENSKKITHKPVGLKFNQDTKKTYADSKNNLKFSCNKETVISNLDEEDPFQGPSPVNKDREKVYRRGSYLHKKEYRNAKLRGKINAVLKDDSEAAQQAARHELLLTEEAGYIETEEGEESWKVTQDEITELSDIATANKKFDLNLNQFGPYKIDYTRNGKFLLLGGSMGHVAAMNWVSKGLMCEMNVMESVNAVKWLHTENLFAVAQRKWTYVYDNAGVEIHCLKKMNNVLNMEFLPYHFLLAGGNANGFLQYLDISIGEIISEIKTKKGRIDVMTQSPSNAVLLLGHQDGTVTMYSPKQQEPLVQMLCHYCPVRAAAIDQQGNYLATSGQNRELRIFDLRTYKPLHTYKVPGGASNLVFSQRGMLAAARHQVVEIYRDPCVETQSKPYLSHRLNQFTSDIMFCPYEDVLGVGCANGFSSIIVPGSGEPNYDTFESNPFRTKKQRQEWEVKALLDKIQPELISLDPMKLTKVDVATAEQLEKDKEERMGYKRQPKKFVPRLKKKGKSSTSNTVRRKVIVRGTKEREKMAEDRRKELMEKRKELRKKTEKKFEKNKSKQVIQSKPEEPIPTRSVLSRFLKKST